MFVATVLAVLCGSCDETETMDNTAFALHYYSVTDIGPSMKYTLHPTYKGAVPSDFAITGITLNDETVAAENIVIDAESGDVTFNPDASLQSGLYRISVACNAGGRHHEFKNIIEVNLLLDTPEGVTMEPSEVIVKMEDEKWWEASSQVITETDKHVTIIGYSIAEDESKEYLKYFTVSGTGVVTFNKDEIANIVPGEKYAVSLKLKTKAGEHIYPDAVVFNVISKPLNLLYTPNEARVENGQAHESQEPTINGSEGITYAIKAVSPEAQGFSINAETGVISLAESAPLQVGDVYTIDVTATNSYGSTDFAEAYKVTIVAFIKPIKPETFTYIVPETYEEKGYDIPVSENFVGDEVIFSFADDNAQIIKDHIERGRISIDVVTGMVHIDKDNALAPGKYSIKVNATNPKGEASTTIALDIKANPNKFTFHYGNNLGLTPAESYANQFEAKNNDALKALKLMPTSDINGRQAKWEMLVLNMQSDKAGTIPFLTGTTLDEATGELNFAESNTMSSVTVGTILVKATVGEGDLAYSVTQPVFVRNNNSSAGKLLYTPFALKMSPKTGGRSTVPVEASEGTTFDFRADFFFHAVDDMENQMGETPKNNGSLLNQLWTRFYKETGANGGNVNTGAKKPMSALDTSNGYSNPDHLDMTLGYVDQDDLSIVINPEKWIDDNGKYANGIFTGKIIAEGNKTGRFAPIVVWFDESFE